MTEEYINGIVRDIQNMSAMGISNVTLKIETALALATELEAVRAEQEVLHERLNRMTGERNQAEIERDALREALEEVRETAADSQGEWYPADKVYTPLAYQGYKGIVETVNDALIRALTNSEAAQPQPAPQAGWTPRRMRVKPDFDVWFYREHGHMPPRISGHDIVIAGETDRNGTHVRNLEGDAGALIPTEYLEPID